MKKLLLSTVLAGSAVAGAAHADCGDVTLSAFSWQSSEAMTYVDQFILANSYGCNVEDSAKWLIENMPDVWTKWVPANVAEKVKAGL